jgi:acyl carrier protein
VTLDKAQVEAEVLELISELADDWEYEGEVTPETLMIRDLGLESLDLVVLGTTIQFKYGELPFAEFLASLGQLPVEERDVTVAGLVTFITDNLPATAATGGSR